MSANSFDHLRAPRWLWCVVVFAGFFTLLFGIIGGCQEQALHSHEGGGIRTGLVSLYHATQMLILHTPHYERPMPWALLAGCLSGAVAVFFGAALALYRRLSREWLLFRLSVWWRKHVVICGLGEKGIALVRSLKAKRPDTRIVVIDPHPDDHLVCECESLDVCVIAEDARKPMVLEQARLRRAKEVIVMTPDDEINVQIAMSVWNRCKVQSSARVECFVHLANINLRERLQKLAGGGREKAARCELSFFDVYDQEARRVLSRLPLDGSGISEDDPRSVHVVILGFGRMGRSLALRAAKMGHFANRKPLRISVIDRNAGLQKERFLFRHPVLAKDNAQDAAFCDLEFYNTDAESLTARRLVECWASEPDTLLHLFICVDANTRAVELAFRFQELLVRQAHCNLLVRIKAESRMVDIFNFCPKAGPRIQIFGMVEDACCEDAFRHNQNDGLARATHRDFVTKRLACSNRTPENDPAMLDWSQLMEDLRESNRQQADHAAIKLRSIGYEMVALSDEREGIVNFSAQEIELLAKMEHARWNAERRLAGWKYGPPAKKEQRISENLCPWNDLHDSFKQYDREVVANIPETLRLVDPPMKVVRKNGASSADTWLA